MFRAAGKDSPVETYNAFYVGGVFCPPKLRSNGIATSMMLRLLSTTQNPADRDDSLPFAKIYDPEEKFLPYARSAAFYGFANSTLFERHGRKGSSALTFVELPINADGSLQISKKIQDVSCDDVRLLYIEDIDDVLDCHADEIKRKLSKPSEQDRYVMSPNGMSNFLTSPVLTDLD